MELSPASAQGLTWKEKYLDYEIETSYGRSSIGMRVLWLEKKSISITRLKHV